MAKSEIEIKNLTGIDALDAMLEKLSKDFGTDMSGSNYGDMSFSPTGSARLDAALSRGGWPLGRVIEIIGDPGSLKTSLALTALAKRQAYRKANNINKRDLIIDLERALEASFIERFGIDLSLIIWMRPDTIEEALQACIDLPKSGFIDFVIFDSVDAGQNEKQLRKKMGEADVGGTSKDMNAAMRQIVKIAMEHQTTYFFINQIKLNPGQMFGSPETTPGGRALSYYASLRIKLLPRQEHKEVPGAALMRLRVTKTRLGPPLEEDVELAFLYARGFDEAYDIESLAKELELLAHSAGQTKVQWTSGSDPVPLLPDIEKGKAAGQAALRTNPLLLERLRHACLRAQGVPTARPDTDFI